MSDQPDPSAAEEEMVITPGGARPRSRVHQVHAGEAVRRDDRGTASVVNLLPAFNKTPSMNSPTQGLVLTPGGYRHPSLVHAVEPGHAVQLVEGRKRLLNLATNAVRDIPEVQVLPGQAPGFGSGWMAYAYWVNNTGNPITSFSTTWIVPPAPTTSSGQTIYLFNGIDPSDPSTGILQPVLQWGPSPDGGGPYWSVASWYVEGAPSNHAFYSSPLVRVNPGDTLVGLMTLTAQSGGLFSYQSEFQGIPGTTLQMQNIQELVWCNQTLEAYRLTQCSDYPAGITAMRAINIQTGATSPTLNWNAVTEPTDCGQHSVVVSNSSVNGEVDIYYSASPSPFSLDHLAQQVEVLFGVTKDGGGVVILPNGRTLHIPPRSPSTPLFRQVVAGMTEVARGFGVQEAAHGTSFKTAGAAIERVSLELMSKGLESVAHAIKQAMAEAVG
jgi:hypothetical protein